MENGPVIMPEGERMPRPWKMAKRLEERLGDGWKNMYHLESQFAHACTRAMGASFEQETRVLRLGGYYDENLCSLACTFMMLAAYRMVEFLPRPVGAKKEKIEVEGTRLLAEVDEWLCGSEQVEPIGTKSDHEY